MSAASRVSAVDKHQNLAAFGLVNEEKNLMAKVVQGVDPFYTTKSGAAFLGDASELLVHVSSGTIQLIVTSPPYALIRKKPYGNVEQERYVEWFMEFAKELQAVLASTGSDELPPHVRDRLEQFLEEM